MVPGSGRNQRGGNPVLGHPLQHGHRQVTRQLANKVSVCQLADGVIIRQLAHGVIIRQLANGVIIRQLANGVVIRQLANGVEESVTIVELVCLHRQLGEEFRRALWKKFK